MKNFIDIFINVVIFVGTLMTIFCLVVFMFVTSEWWMALLAGLSSANALFVYDKFRQKNNK
jgi:hypothetical protein